MKKLTKTLLLTSVFILSGCNNPQPEKVRILFKDESLTAATEFSEVKDVNDMITNKDSFLLVSYADAACSCWSTFKELVLNPFVKETNIPVYIIETSLLEGDHKGLPINRNLTNTPVIGVFSEGTYKYGIAYNEDSSVFIQKDKFVDWIDRHIERPIMTFISFERLKELLKGTDPFIINWTLAPCPDCVAINDRFMPEYLKNNKVTQKLPYYLFETLPIRRQPELWTEVKRVYGLSDELNTESGYGTGFVPAIQVIHPDGTDYVTKGDVSPIIKDMFVFQNEFVEKVDGVYKISDSYFNGVRATKYLGEYESEIGKVVPDEDVVETVDKGPRFVAGARYEVSAKYAAKFFDYYWK